MDSNDIQREMEEAQAADALQARLNRQREDAQRHEELKELKRLVSIENHRQDALRAIRGMAPMLEPPKLQDAPIGLGKMPHHTWAPIVSDWQLGQKDTMEGTGRLFEQSSEITKGQVHEMWNRVALQHDIQSRAKVVDELVIFSLGDLMEGDQMRVSQAAHVDSLATKQALDVTDLEAWILNQALARFPKVRLLHVGGNHDRTSAKGGYAGLGELGYTDTYSWLTAEFLRRMFERAIDSGRLEIENYESFFGAAYVAGQRCVFEHGASFRASTGSYGGVSYYSIANAAAGYQKMLDGADLVIMGHHHVPMVLPAGGWAWQIMNGALPPSSAFVQSNFKGYRRPSQIMLDLHPDLGLVGWHPMYLETKHTLRPGEFWASVPKRDAITHPETGQAL